MGLDTSHGCWSGAYSAFHRWRSKIAEAAGFGDLLQYQSYDGNRAWPEGDVLVELLHHPDNEGELRAEICTPLADRLEQLLPALRTAGDGGGHVGSFVEKTQKFIDGLRRAAATGEAVEFH